MNLSGFTLFDTDLGRLGIAWRAPESGVALVLLPGADDRAIRGRVLGRLPDAVEAAPPARVQCAIDDIATLLSGRVIDLAGIALDFAGVPPFHRRVYEVARTIAPGTTRTYGEVALALGSPGSARAVGQALGRNPFAVVVPCHRVLAAGGKMGGFSADGGTATKLRMLAIEGYPAP